MAKTKEKKQFYTDKDILEGKATEGAPKVGGEFVTEEGDWRGQTVEVQSDTKLEEDKGTGPAVILRAFQFTANPETFKAYEEAHGHLPYAQDIFESHKRGIMALLWQDGLTPTEEIAPRLILSKDKTSYLIMVGAVPSFGQTLLEKTKTLTEITNDKRNNKNKVSGKLPVSST